MCGIAGIVNLTPAEPVREQTLRQMLALIRHRGPDEFGLYLDTQAGLASARLSIVDLQGGQQPITNEDRSLWIVFNGEIYNHPELRRELQVKGHYFTTRTDTEVILHLYEEDGPDCLQRLNGQFAIAIWDARRKTLFLARDRVGIRPLYYTLVNNTLIFASEIKAILADPRVQARIDPEALTQVFTCWSTLSPKSIFRSIVSVPPGCCLLATRGQTVIQPYWRLSFPPRDPPPAKSLVDALEEFRTLLVNATQIRLRADVPVAAYLSGGLDSSLLTAIIRQYTDTPLDAFSIVFEDASFDERTFQEEMAAFLRVNRQVVEARNRDIGRVFPQVIWHTEIPVMRTSPAPMFLLSRLVQEHGYKVVVTGEGADEILAGYNIFKEARVRRFWARQPDSVLRPLLLYRLYPYLAGLSATGRDYLTGFFRPGLTDVTAADYSHAVRWRNMTRLHRFFSADIRQAARPLCPDYPPSFASWHPLSQAQYLEMTIFMSQYLLSSQGDRMGMAHSVEGRFPFLDHRLIEFCNHLPPDLKLHGLTEKYLLRQLGRQFLPRAIFNRPKKPYRAPIAGAFFHPNAPDYVLDLLSPRQVRTAGLFNPVAVERLVKKVGRGIPLGETDEMALVGILSSQLVYRLFVADFRPPPPLPETAAVKVCRGAEKPVQV
ncbi:MAG: asparagine synthase (glutamine-hydrolyzing) [Chloroflexi bacterium]|nr:MAG: asparagine synthase (glutamine-hydrolyzing) [Chloroflexota bacterium]